MQSSGYANLRSAISQTVAIFLAFDFSTGWVELAAVAAGL